MTSQTGSQLTPTSRVSPSDRRRPVVGPNNEDLAAKREAFNVGPCWVKLLVSDKVAGSIIGKGGTVISDLEKNTNAIMKLSPGRTYFPGTQDRLVVIAGSIESIVAATREVIEKVKMATLVEEHRRDPSAPVNVDITIKVVVPNSAVSCIIGRGGEVVREINKTTGALIRASERYPGLHERVVQVSGSQQEVTSAATEVIQRVQSDRNLREHLNVVYTPSAGTPTTQPPLSPAESTSPGVYPTATAPAAVLSYPCAVAFDVEDSIVSGLIGRGGSALHRIASQTGATVTLSHREVSETGEPKRTVRITGSLTAVQQAHLLLVRQIYETAAGGATAAAAAAARPYMQPVMYQQSPSK